MPNSVSEVQEVYTMLGDYKAKHYTVILLGFASAYLTKQVENKNKKRHCTEIATVQSDAYKIIIIIIIIIILIIIIIIIIINTQAHDGNIASSITSPSYVIPNSNLSQLIRKSPSI